MWWKAVEGTNIPHMEATTWDTQLYEAKDHRQTTEHLLTGIVGKTMMTWLQNRKSHLVLVVSRNPWTCDFKCLIAIIAYRYLQPPIQLFIGIWFEILMYIYMAIFFLENKLMTVWCGEFVGLARKTDLNRGKALMKWWLIFRVPILIFFSIHCSCKDPKSPKWKIVG